MRGLLKRIFDYALTCGLIQANPVTALPTLQAWSDTIDSLVPTANWIVLRE